MVTRSQRGEEALLAIRLHKREYASLSLLNLILKATTIHLQTYTVERLMANIVSLCYKLYSWPMANKPHPHEKLLINLHTVLLQAFEVKTLAIFACKWAFAISILHSVLHCFIIHTDRQTLFSGLFQHNMSVPMKASLHVIAI